VGIVNENEHVYHEPKTCFCQHLNFHIFKFIVVITNFSTLYTTNELLEKLLVVQLLKKFVFKRVATGPYRETDEFSLQPHANYFLKIRFDIIPPTLKSPKWSLSASGFPITILYEFLHFLKRSTCHARTIIYLLT
jgi:hypothetical protein